ncbi:MAG: SRPBCC domain-containing protein [Bacteroidota bacterium]
MITKNKARFTKDAAGKKITVIKEVDASPDKVWEAWTTSQQLDKWWAPKPYKAVTRRMDFREGGSWLYKMEGPEGKGQWDKFEYNKIDKPKLYTAKAGFSDENGQRKPGEPVWNWKNSFIKTADGTRIESEISFEKKEDMDKILDTGFEEGYSSGLDNLDELLSH